ncbi:hypothetical protein [Paraurantiacibacter namhicola]|uniref:hypothetical protein n=1 Tax=Paraurantiacibacter namhicola TaxID=645517 RepID=UPI001F225129|nr:hypothetical protein [Paraurantiacibacter namhicola]
MGLGLSLQACLAKAAWDVATLPVKAAGAVVDGVTTSQSEADEKRGREIRKLEERLGRLERDYYKADAKCLRGDAEKCRERDSIAAEMREISRQLPASPEP